jgi:hypothetical protein
LAAEGLKVEEINYEVVELEEVKEVEEETKIDEEVYQMIMESIERVWVDFDKSE